MDRRARHVGFKRVYKEEGARGTHSGVLTQMMSRWQKYTHSLSRKVAHEQRLLRTCRGGPAGAVSAAGADRTAGRHKHLVTPLPGQNRAARGSEPVPEQKIQEQVRTETQTRTSILQRSFKRTDVQARDPSETVRVLRLSGGGSGDLYRHAPSPPTPSPSSPRRFVLVPAELRGCGRQAALLLS